MPASNPTTAENTVIVRAAEAGQRQTVQSVPGGNLQFQGVNPAEAEFSRSQGSNDLVITQDNGGAVVIQDYFQVGDNSLPSLTLADGSVVQAADFFAGSNLDISTAAGPGAGAPGSGGTSYDDATGALLGGVDKFGMLGTDYWARSAEVVTDYVGNDEEMPSGSFSLGVITFFEGPGGSLNAAGGLFEDGMRNQHQGDNEVTPGRIVFEFTTSGTTVVTSVVLTGFHDGTEISFSDGSPSILVSGPGEPVSFTQAQLDAGVFVTPPPDSDLDMAMNVLVNVATANGVPGVMSGGFTLVVEAVADKPVFTLPEGAEEYAEYFGDDESFRIRVEGDLTEHQSAGKKGDGFSQELTHLEFPAAFTFGDVTDGSEAHHVRVENVPAEWLLQAWPNDLDGDYEVVDNGDGTVTYIFLVPAGQDTVSGSFAFNPREWTNQRGHDGEARELGPDGKPVDTGGATVIIRGTAQETPSDLEIPGYGNVNDYAETAVEYKVSIQEDVPALTGARVITDESAGVQFLTTDEIFQRFMDPAAASLVRELAGDAAILSVAQNSIQYDLNSDGDSDGRGAEFQSHFGFGAPGGAEVDADGNWTAESSWHVTGSDTPITLHGNIHQGYVVGMHGDEIAFIISATGSFNDGENTGALTFVQYMSLSHPDAGTLLQGAHNEKMAETLDLTLIVYDADGDSAEAAVSFDVRDDGPSIGLLGGIGLDETNILTAENGDTYIQNSDVIRFDVGADLAGSTITWDKGVLPDLTVNGHPVEYSFNADATEITGTVTIDGQTVTVLTMTLSDIDMAGGTAVYTYTQYTGVDHPKPGDGSETNWWQVNSHDEPTGMGFVVTVTDGDGDTASKGIVVTVKDDGPGITSVETAVVDETDFNHYPALPSSHNAISQSQPAVITYDAGFDSIGASVTWDAASLPEGLTSHGKAVSVSVDSTGTVVTGTVPGPFGSQLTVFKLTLTDNGDGQATYQYTQYLPLDHPDQEDHDDPIDLGFKVVVTDGDGDWTSAAVSVTVKDDGPEVKAYQNVQVSLSETDLPGGTDQFHKADNLPGEFNVHDESVIVGTFGYFDYGNDGPHAAKPFEWTEPEGDYTTADGTPIVWAVSADGLTMLGYPEGGGPEDAVIVFKAGSVTGILPAGYSVEQNAPVFHARYGEDGELLSTDQVLSIEAGFLIRDYDGDTAPGVFTVDIHDDAPRIGECSQNVRVGLSETDLPGGTDWLRIHNDVPGNVLNEARLVGFLTFTYGADGPAGANTLDGEGNVIPAFAWNADSLAGYETANPAYVPGGDEPANVAVRWVVSGDGLTLTGYAGESDTVVIVFEASLQTPLGASYTVELLAPIQHALEQEHGPGHFHTEPEDFLSLPVGFTITDRDGDSQSGSLTVNVKDDVPCAGHCAIGELEFEFSLRPEGGGQIVGGGDLIVRFGADGPSVTELPVQWRAWLDAGQENFDPTLEGVQVLISGTAYNVILDVDASSATHLVYIAVDEDNRPVAETPAIELTLNDDYSYTYTQNYAVKHDEKGLGDVAKTLDFGYVVTDRDGDTAVNDLSVTVVDSHILPSVDFVKVDESYYDKATGQVSATFVLDNLDYSAPDSLVNAVWNQEWTQKAIDAITDDLFGTAIEVVVVGNVMYLYDDKSPDKGGPAVTMTLSFNSATGMYEVEYVQHYALDHPLGGIFHDDKLLLPLVVNTSSGDDDMIPNVIGVIVDDDGPRPLIASNIGLVESVGDAFVRALYDGLAETLDGFKDYLNPDGTVNPDFLQTDALVNGLAQTLEGVLDNIAAGGADLITDGLDLISLVTDKSFDLTDIVSNVGVATIDLLAAGVALALGDTASAKTSLLSGLQKLANALPGDEARDEAIDKAYEGAFTPDFGYDGANTETPVQWDVKGITLLFSLLQVKASGDDAVVTLANSSATELVFADSGGDPVLTLSLVDNGDGSFGYAVTQHQALQHNAGPLDSLLSGLGEALNATLSDGLASLLQSALSGLNIGSVDELLGLLTGEELLQAMGIDPATLLGNLGSGNLLTLPLPILVTDGDGDVAPGLITVTIRDSQPSMTLSPTALEVAEADLDSVDYAGTDAAHGRDNAPNNPNDDETVAEGSFQFTYGLDGKGAATITDAAGDVVDIYAAHEYGRPIAGHYGFLMITSISESGGTVTVDYEYTLKETAQHDENGLVPDNTAISAYPGPETFAVTVTDSDGSKISATINVTIIDDAPLAKSDWDVMDELDGGGWSASGNILTGVDTFGENFRGEAGADQYGADGRAAAGWLSVEGADVPVDGIRIAGKFGYLEIDAEGDYTYTTDADLTAATLAKTGSALTPIEVVLEEVAISGNPVSIPDQGSPTGLKLSGLDTHTGGPASFGSYTLSYTVVESILISWTDDSGPQTATVTSADLTDGWWPFPDGSTGITDISVEYLNPTYTTQPTLGNGFLESLARAAFERLVVDPIKNGGCTVESVAALVADPNAYSEVFDYAITDKDGDVSTAQLIINPDTQIQVVTGPETLNVDEKYLGTDDRGADATPGTLFDADNPDSEHLTAQGSVTVRTTEGIAAIRIAGVEFVIGGPDADGVMTLTPENGADAATAYGKIGEATLTDKGDGEYEINFTYTLTTNDPASPAGDGPGADGFDIVITDKIGGDEATIPVSIAIEDDAPRAVNDALVLEELETSLSGNVVSGKHASYAYNTVVRTDIATAPDAYGADGPAKAEILDADDNPIPAFAWAKNGSADNPLPVITFQPKTGEDSGVPVYGEAVALTVTQTGPDTYALTYQADDDSPVIQLGVIELGANGDYIYTRAHGASAEGKISVGYSIADLDGDAETASLIITLTPDGNTLEAGTGSATVFESDIEGGPYVEKGSDPEHKLDNKESDVYEENPAAYAEDDPARGDNQAVSGGQIELDFGAGGAGRPFAWFLDENNNPRLGSYVVEGETRYTDLQARVDDSWQKVFWKYGELENGDPDYTVLIGYVPVGDTHVPVLTLAIDIDAATTGNSYTYTVTLEAAIRHDLPLDDAAVADSADAGKDQDYDRNFDINGFNDVDPTELVFGFSIANKYGMTADGTVTVQIQDDILAVEDSRGTVQWTQGEELGALFEYDNQNVLTHNHFPVRDRLPGESDEAYAAYRDPLVQADRTGYELSDDAAAALIRGAEGVSSAIVRMDENGNLVFVTSVEYDGEGNLVYTTSNNNENPDGNLEWGSVYQNSTGIHVGGSTLDQEATPWVWNENVPEEDRIPENRTETNGHWGLPSDRFNEINYDAKYDVSEAVVIDLDGLAFGIKIELSEFYGRGEDELGLLVFFRYNETTGEYEQVGTAPLISNDTTGYYQGSATLIQEPFDRVVILATNNGNGLGSDNSDFGIKTVQFIIGDEDIVRYERSSAGEIEPVGADGVMEGSYRFDIEDGQVYRTGDDKVIVFSYGDITNADGGVIGTDYNHVTGTVDGKKVFDAYMGSDGSWTFLQYADIVPAEGDDYLPIGFSVRDNDGDYSRANILVDSKIEEPAEPETLVAAYDNLAAVAFDYVEATTGEIKGEYPIIPEGGGAWNGFASGWGCDSNSRHWDPVMAKFTFNYDGGANTSGLTLTDINDHIAGTVIGNTLGRFGTLYKEFSAEGFEDGDGISFNYTLAGSPKQEADAMVVLIKDASGAVVYSHTLQHGVDGEDYGTKNGTLVIGRSQFAEGATGPFTLYINVVDVSPTEETEGTGWSDGAKLTVWDVKVVESTEAYFNAETARGNVIEDTFHDGSGGRDRLSNGSALPEGAILTGFAIDNTWYYFQPEGDVSYSVVETTGEGGTVTRCITLTTAEGELTVADNGDYAFTPANVTGSGLSAQDKPAFSLDVAYELRATVDGVDKTDTATLYLRGEDQIQDHSSATENVQLTGTSADDVLIGGAGGDILAGGAGDDILFGGEGNDVFYFENGAFGHDTIMDFQLGQDVLRFENLFDTNGDEELTALIGNGVFTGGVFKVQVGGDEGNALEALFSDDKVELSVTQGGEQSSITVMMSDSPAYANPLDDPAAAAELLAQMIKEGGMI